MNKRVIIIGILILILLAGVLFWLNIKNDASKDDQKNQPKQEQDNADKKEVSEIDTSNWRTYKNEKYGFEFKYPPGLLLEEADENKFGKIVSLKSLDASTTDLNGNSSPMFNYVLEVSRWSSINNKYAPGGEWEGQRQYENLEDFFTDTQAPKKKIGEIWLGDQRAYEVKIAGIAATYGIMFERKDGIWQIEFPSVLEKEYLGDQEKEIIASFEIGK